MTSHFPRFASRELISERLSLVFPEGTVNRGYLTRELSASTIFCMLYIGAIEGSGIYMGPVHVYRMTHEQSSLTSDDERESYRVNVKKKSFMPAGERWYADNTREPIRDETLREGLVLIGAVLSDETIPTTSSKPRYSLKKDFTALFNPEILAKELEEKILEWQNRNLSKAALDRLSLNKFAAGKGDSEVMITFPNKETRIIEPGPSSEISKRVIEVFAANFLEKPVVLWLSTSGGKVVARDEKLASSIGLKIAADKNLPDIILADLGPEKPMIVFIEVVASDGAVTERRQRAIHELTDDGGFDRSQIKFMTAYLDRGTAAFKKTVAGLAWDSYAWFVSEPDKLIQLRGQSGYLEDFK